MVSAEKAILNDNFLRASVHNIVYASKFIETPFEALGLVVDSVTRINKKLHVTLNICLESKDCEISNGVSRVVEKNHLFLSVDGLNLNKKEMQELTLSYRCEQNDPGFDLKNGLMRLGK